MKIPKELKEKIEKVFYYDKELMERLLNLDPHAIKQIGVITESGISPKKIIEAHEKNNMEAIYNLAVKKVETEEIYLDLVVNYSLSVASKKDKSER